MKKFSALLLAMLLILSLVSTAALAAGKPGDKTSTAKVFFEDGVLEFGKLEGATNMDLDFGKRKLSVIAETYAEASTGSTSHSLTVLDAESALNNWSITGKLDKFAEKVESSKTFDGTITLKSGTSSHPGVLKLDEDTTTHTISFYSDGSAVQVMNAKDTGIDAYKATWSSENITLSLTADESKKVAGYGVNKTYIAEMTWTFATY